MCEIKDINKTKCDKGEVDITSKPTSFFDQCCLINKSKPYTWDFLQKRNIVRNIVIN